MSIPSSSNAPSHDSSKMQRRESIESRQEQATLFAQNMHTEEGQRASPTTSVGTSNPNHPDVAQIKGPDLHVPSWEGCVSDTNSVVSDNVNTYPVLPQASVSHATNPFEKMPLELLVLIFRLGTKDSPATFPTLVAQVTRQWRETALSQKDLWTWINWDGADPEEKTICWLERSRSLDNPKHSAPIHISLCVEDGFNADIEKMEDIMRLLRPEIHRWGSFKIHVNREALEVALELCDVAAPVLRTLSIRCSESEGVEDQFVLFDNQTPALQDLCLVRVPVVWTGPLLRNLTVLHLAEYEDGLCPSVEELAAILAASPDLQKLVLDNAGISTRVADGFFPEVIGLLELEYLQLTSVDWDVYLWLIRNVRMPRVHTYVSNGFDCAEDQKQHCGHVGRPFPLPNLQKFIAHHANVNTHFVHMMLATVKTLISIELSYCFVDSLLEKLIWKPEIGKGSCPNLTELTLQRCAGFSVERVKRLVVSRQATNCDDPRTITLQPTALLVKVIGSALSVSVDDLNWFAECGVEWIGQVLDEAP
ncbi:hypothetical protein FRB96_005329 [Tulasnella sp. 330]|nr:hypothetical protein FRB96_005329 [Tulasnella sp. 330]KAG8875161.1 hypothetical protein FRB98_008056 [Tulasnella sp. 332]